MIEILLVEIGSLPRGLVRRVGAFVARALPAEVRVYDGVLDPDPAFVAERGQYDTRPLMSTLAGLAPSGRVVGLTEVDVFSTVFAYVFGEARLGGRAAIVSMYRLDPRIYGLAEDPMRRAERLEKETLHEIGHLLGLTHCHDSGCVMSPSTDPTEVDMKPADFCPACREAAAAR